MTRCQPIRFTQNLTRWRDVLVALGGQVGVDSPRWTTVGFGQGVVALHASDVASAEAGSTELWFQVRDPQAVAATLTQWGATVEQRELAGGLHAWEARTPDGQKIGLSPWNAAEDQRPDAAQATAVLPLWVTPQVDEAVETLVALGAQRRLTSQSGQWIDLSLPDGLVAAHGGEQAGTVLSFEYDGDVTDLVEPLAQAGANPRLMDENYGRTVRFDDPDGGEEIWINERQTDLYGYRQG